MSDKSPGKLPKVVLSLVIVGLIGFIAWQVLPKNELAVRRPAIQEDSAKDEDAEDGKKRQSRAEALGLSPDEMANVGEVLRPKRDVVTTEIQVSSEGKAGAPIKHPGLLPALKGKENPQVAGLYKELSQEKPPAAAMSPMFAPEPFDKDAYLKDPKAYLNQVRPGRVFQSAQPGPDVTPIEPEGPTYAEVVQGERVVLKVKAENGMPVTFHSDLGVFENQLKTLSVAASEDGIAQATFFASTGTVGLVNIMAASPVHSEDVLFLVEVALPE